MTTLAVAGPSVAARVREALWTIFRPVLVLGTVLVAWQIAATIMDNTLFLPRLNEVWKRASTLWSTGALQGHLAISTQRAVLGFAIASVAGFAIGILSGAIGWVRRLLSPLISASYPIPKIGLIPLFILWLGIGEASKLAVIVTAAIYPVIINVESAVAGVDKRLIWRARTLGASRLEIFRRVIMPAALPGTFVGLRLAMGLSWILLFAAEMVASSDGLGHLIIRSQQAFDTSGVFVSLLAIALLGMMFDALIELAYRRSCHWHLAQAAT